MAQLPYIQTQDRVLSQIETQWKSALDPLLANPVSQGILLKNIALANGTTVINHLLDRNQQGWIVTDVSGAATIYRSQPFNNKTLTLTSNAAVSVNLLVY